MDSKRIAVLKTSFDGLSHIVAEEHVEYWLARDLMPHLGYTLWENFVEAIHRTKIACSTQKNEISDHFRDITKMIDLPKGAKRDIADVMLSRYDKSIGSDSASHLPPPNGGSGMIPFPNLSTLL